MRIAFFVLLAAILLPTLLTKSVLLGQDDKKESDRPKEAVIESIAQELSPELRKQIAELLSKEIDRVARQLATEQKDLEQLRAKLKDQEGKVERSTLKLEFLKDRFKQWSPVEDED